MTEYSVAVGGIMSRCFKAVFRFCIKIHFFLATQQKMARVPAVKIGQKEEDAFIHCVYSSYSIVCH